MIFSSSLEPKKWTSVEAKLLRDFLDSDAGKLALDWVIFQAPELLDGSDRGKTLVASGEVKGYQGALTNLYSLTVEQPAEAKVPENYPDLDSDSAWKHLDTQTENPT